jgi:integrase
VTLARVKDLWFSEVPVKGPDGKTVRDDTEHVVTAKRKTAKHPDRGGNKSAKRWLACWDDPDGKEKTRAFAKQADAMAYAEKMEGDAQRGLYIDPEAAKELFGPLAEKWLRLAGVGGASAVKYESTYRVHVKPAFARRRLGAVRPSDILEWLASEEMKAVGDSIRGMAFIIVRAVFDLAVADKKIRENPTRSTIVKPPGGDEAPRKSWPVQVIWRVRDAHPEEYRPIADCQAGLGARQGEALAIAEEDIDFEAGKVHICRQVARVGNVHYFKLPKEGRDRWVPLPLGLASILRAYIDEHPPRPYELPWLAEDGRAAKDPHVCRLVFRWHGSHPRTRGQHIRAHSYDTGVWNVALGRAGVVPFPEEGSGKRPGRNADGNGTHIMRRWYATTLQDAGVSPVGVTTFMGHSLKALPVTFRVYGSVTEETFDQARQAIDRSLYKLRPAPPAGTVAELRSAQ